jgi:hypothetical protein
LWQDKYMVKGIWFDWDTVAVTTKGTGLPQPSAPSALDRRRCAVDDDMGDADFLFGGRGGPAAPPKPQPSKAADAAMQELKAELMYALGDEDGVALFAELALDGELAADSPQLDSDSDPDPDPGDVDDVETGAGRAEAVGGDDDDDETLPADPTALTVHLGMQDNNWVFWDRASGKFMGKFYSLTSSAGWCLKAQCGNPAHRNPDSNTGAALSRIHSVTLCFHATWVGSFVSRCAFT